MSAPRLLVATAFALLVGVTLAPSAVAQDAPNAAARWPSLTDVPTKAPGGGQDDAAVVVGIEKYAFLTGIPGAKANALAWERWLRDVRQIPGERVHVLTDNDGTREKILTHVRKAAAGVQKGGTLWIVFIGHGAPSREKRADGQDDGVLVGVDAQQDPDGFYVRAVAQGDVVGVAREAAARGANPVVILDACFSGQDATGASLLPGRMVALPASLARVADVMVLSAGRAKEMAGPLPGPADRPRPAFSYLLLGGLRGWADASAAGAPGDGRVTPGEALSYVRAVFNKLDPTRSQTPECYPEKLCTRPLARSAGEKAPDLGALASSMSGGAGNPYGQPFQPFQPFDGGLDYGENIQNTVVDDTGFLLVTSEPSGATVMLNGKEVGKTPFQKEVMVGRYRIVLEGVALHHAHQEEITLTTAGAKKMVTLRPAFGRLVVETTPPGARVNVDGADVGAGPYTDPRRRSGRYEIRAAADLYLSARQTVEVTDGQETRVSLRLEPNFGALRVESTPPGGEILLDGTATGQVTPYTFERKQVGTYAVSVRRSGYGERGGKASVRVGATETLALALEAKLGLLSVTSLDGDGAPCEGALAVDGVAQGTTPTKVQLPEGRHEVTVRCGAAEGRETVQVGHNEKARVEVRMPARARPRPSEDQPAAFSGSAPAGYVAIPAGEFMMGSPEDEEWREDDEEQHRVRITRGFYMKATEVTQGEWESVMGPDQRKPARGVNVSSAGVGPYFRECGASCPMESVSWKDAVAYLNKLSDKEGLPRCYDSDGDLVTLDCEGYRLPTEAEWEYAARAGSTGAQYGRLEEIAWYSSNSDEKTHPVAAKAPNAWGLYDVLGNVREWTNDRYGDYLRRQGNVNVGSRGDDRNRVQTPDVMEDPRGPDAGSYRVIRGGREGQFARSVRLAHRSQSGPSEKHEDVGLRPVRGLPLSDGERRERLPKAAIRRAEQNVPPGYVAIPAGVFMMGSPDGEEGRSVDEKQHRVTITRDFYLKTTEVTQGEWESLMGSNPSFFRKCGKNCPVENVSWMDTTVYLNKLSDGEGLPRCYDGSGTLVALSCRGYRLPTEAEWEYAARAGSTGPHYGDLEAIAWYGDNSGKSTQPVGQKQPNAWGLYDMLGNVWEWTNDCYGDYQGGEVTDPVGPASGRGRVRRGGSWGDRALNVRGAYRSGFASDDRNYFLGFRPVRAR